MKPLLKRFVAYILWRQVNRLRKKHDFKVIAVAGSVGKTSTKFAIASLLEEKFKVRYQTGNYNDIVTVPLVFFDLPLPSLFNPFAWIATFLRIAKSLRKDYPYEVVVLEIGTDGPGQIGQYSGKLHADIGVLTAIASEHIEYFGSIEAVANEELQTSVISDQMLVNIDLCDEIYLKSLHAYMSYSAHRNANYRITNRKLTKQGQSFYIEKEGEDLLQTTHPSIALASGYSILAACSIGDMLGMSADELKAGIVRIEPVSGRLQILSGIKDSTLIDDTYNASPVAMKAALQTLYTVDAPQKIALLGNMNELGTVSAQEHADIGKACDSKQLDLVVTLGKDANQYLVPEAEKRGCHVVTTSSPIEAGRVITEAMNPGAWILLKGSQNGVFAEEAVKALLADPADAARLVRQSQYWLNVKKEQFGSK